MAHRSTSSKTTRSGSASNTSVNHSRCLDELCRQVAARQAKMEKRDKLGNSLKKRNLDDALLNGRDLIKAKRLHKKLDEPWSAILRRAGVHRNTAALHMRIFRNRKIIKAARKSNPPFSINDADALIRNKTKREAAIREIKTATNVFRFENSDVAKTSISVWSASEIRKIPSLPFREAFAEDGRSGSRSALSDRTDNFAYTGSYSVADVAFLENMLLRYADPEFFSNSTMRSRRIFNPCAGGPELGIIATILGHEYIGIELRPEQIAENNIMAHELDVAPTWLNGDARDLSGILSRHGIVEPFDLAYMCPPYHQLEKYSDDPACLANAAGYVEFLRGMQDIATGLVEVMQPDGFVILVVGNILDPHQKKSRMREELDLAGDIAREFQQAGFLRYDSFIKSNPTGSAPKRAPQQWQSSKRLVRTHEHALVFRLPTDG